ncbi:hypothetical protein AVEN_88481-1 [Araneus ventricosus]|uniref:Uncharacterized protein n=1 Tax=Araneus ventricosus TaxID=182803 RepID=A0A4Y2TPF0_ARAVE|nr:hypothetical protein AVEN_88481-1 [Araneus ventricosus]
MEHPHTAMEHPQTAMEHPQTAIEYPPTAVVLPQTAVKHPQTAAEHPHKEKTNLGLGIRSAIKHDINATCATYDGDFPAELLKGLVEFCVYDLVVKKDYRDVSATFCGMVWFGLVEFTGAKTIFDYAAPNIWSRIKS